MNNSNNNKQQQQYKQDPLTELLSLPISFTVDPLNFNDMTTLPQKRQEPVTSFVSKKKSKISLEDKDQKTKER